MALLARPPINARPGCCPPWLTPARVPLCSQEPDDYGVLMPFCKDFVNYRACVPSPQGLMPELFPTPVDPLKRDLGITINSKDQWIKKT